MKRTVNLKRYIEDCIRNRARRRRLCVLLGVLCLALALGVMDRLMKPAITVTARPECGREEHVHGEACYTRTLVCGLDEGEGHTHGEDCYASVLSCGKEEHTHDASCYPEELAEQTLEPEATIEATVTAEPEETAEATAAAAPEETAEVTATAAPEETAEATPTAAPEETVEATGTAEPEETAETTAEPEQTDAPQVSLDPLDGPVKLRAGEEGVWEAHAACAERLTYEVTNEQGETIAQGDVSEGTVRLAIDRSGLYLLRVTAHEGENQAAQCLNLAVSDGELVGGVTASLSCFGGDEAAFDLHFEGGVQPVSCRVSIWQDGELLWEGEAQDAARAATRTLETVSEVTAKAVWTDACGQSVQAEASMPCAVRKIETRAEWERSFAQLEKTGEWPNDLLELARTQLGYEESAINFVVDEEGERHGYTRYGDWYGNDHAAWCAMYISFCLHYADVPEAYFPIEANCAKWIRALDNRGLYLKAGEYEPKPGDLVFFDWEGDGVADHVGLVEKVDEKLHTIEGNTANRVKRVEYEPDDRAICGYGWLDGAWQRYVEEHPTETPVPEESMEPTETPAPEESMEPTETPVPEETLEPGTDEWNRLAARISALEIPADADEEALAQYDAALQETLGAVLSARENGAIDEGETAKLLEALILRQAGGESGRFAALRETVSGLTQPAEDASADEKVEYDAALSALREQLAGAYQAGEITKCEYSLLQLLLEQAPECPVQCVYTAREGAVRVVHDESGELGQEALTARILAPEDEEYAARLQELTAYLALENRGAAAQAMLLEIGFTGEGSAQVTLRLTDEVAAGENLLAAHRGENGWEWLESERLTGEDGAVYVTFRAESFSTFAVLSLSETAAEGVELKDYCAGRGGEMTLELRDAQGEPLMPGEDGAYRVQADETYLLRLSVRSEAGLDAGAYRFSLPERVLTDEAEGGVWAEAPEKGAWQTDADGHCVRIALTAPEGETGLALDVPLRFSAGDEPIALSEGLEVYCEGEPVVDEPGDDAAWQALCASGYFTYWSDRLREMETSPAKAPMRRAETAGQEGNMPSGQQIVNGGGEESKSDGVTVSKTIAGTELENVFDITLTVKTATELSTFYKDPDMAVVVVMDISNTMVTYMGDITRYEAAMRAADNFIDEFSKSTSGISKVGYVAFNTHGHRIFDLQSCKDETEAMRLKNTMRQETWKIMDAYVTGDPNRFTNMEAGLKMARDMLAGAKNKNKYIIFLSDGFPTTYISSGYSGYDATSSGGDRNANGTFVNRRNGYYCKYGTNYSDKAAIRARKMAGSIKNSDIEIFSIGVDIGGQSLPDFLSQGTTGTDHFSTVDCTNSDFEIGRDGTVANFENWLQYGIGSGVYYNSTNTEGLKNAYNQIFAQIKGEIESGSHAMWVTNDPLPTVGTTKYVEFINFFDKNGALRGPLSGSNTDHGENSAAFDGENSAIKWDLKKSGFAKTLEGGRTIYSYRLTYRVRLKNEVGDFVENGPYNTNDTTTLTYQVVETQDGQTVFSEKRTIDYPIPAVKGYLAELKFRKIDGNDLAVPGAVFTLAHAAECSACRGDETPVPLGTFTATSDASGSVSFARIPSGHTYTLTETKVPDGYRADGNTYRVQVAYDQLTVTVTAPDGSIQIWNGDGNDAVVNIGLPRLPETGGTGILPYVIGGFVLMAISLLCGRAMRRKGERGAGR